MWQRWVGNSLFSWLRSNAMISEEGSETTYLHKMPPSRQGVKFSRKVQLKMFLMYNLNSLKCNRTFWFYSMTISWGSLILRRWECYRAVVTVFARTSCLKTWLKKITSWHDVEKKTTKKQNRTQRQLHHALVSRWHCLGIHYTCILSLLIMLFVGLIAVPPKTACAGGFFVPKLMMSLCDRTGCEG